MPFRRSAASHPAPFHDPNLLARQPIQLVDQLIDLPVGRGDLALNRSKKIVYFSRKRHRWSDYAGSALARKAPVPAPTVREEEPMAADRAERSPRRPRRRAGARRSRERHRVGNRAEAPALSAATA